jgi:hypothetical protein
VRESACGELSHPSAIIIINKLWTRLALHRDR